MTEDEENENEEKKVEYTSGKTLLELEQESLRKLEQFVVITWQPRPNKGTVRIWIDDGTFKMTMKNEKFIEILESILLKDEEHPMYQTYYNLKNIENSLNQKINQILSICDNITKDLNKNESINLNNIEKNNNQQNIKRNRIEKSKSLMVKNNKFDSNKILINTNK